MPSFGNFEDYITKLDSPESFYSPAPVTLSETLKTINSLNHTTSTGDFSIPKQIF